MVKIVILSVIVLFLIIGIVKMLPDFIRYMKIRAM